MRVLGVDTSLTCPAAAIIEVKDGKAKLVAVSHVTTSSKQLPHLRGQIVYAWLLMFLAQHGTHYDAIIREDFTGKTSLTNAPVFSAWAATDRALADHGLIFDKWKEPRKKTTYGVAPTRVKKLVAGSGSADKAAVADGVRKITGYEGPFATDDESDAAAIALAYAIQQGALKV